MCLGRLLETKLPLAYQFAEQPKISHIFRNWDKIKIWTKQKLLATQKFGEIYRIFVKRKYCNCNSQIRAIFDIQLNLFGKAKIDNGSNNLG